jgi:hypothetical protein
MDVNPSRERPPLHWLTPVRFGFFIGALLLAAFPKVLLGWNTFYYRDYGVWGYPYAFYQHESFWRGELPLWNGLSNCGAPLLAQWGTMTLYPFSIIYLLFPLPWSLTYFSFAHLFLGSLGMFYLCLNWSGSRAGGAVAGTAYLFNGLAFSCLIWPSYLVALGWMPWVVLTAERAALDGGRRIVFAAVVAALQLLAGAPEIVAMTWLLMAALWIHSLIRRPRSEDATIRENEQLDWATTARKWIVRNRVLSCRILAIVLLAAGLAAAQLLPFFDLLLHSNRDASFSDSKWAMPSWGWANFFVPLFHCFQTFQGPFFQQSQAFFGSYYLGVGILALAVWGIWKCSDSRIWILASVAAFAALLALGENGFLYSIAKQISPLIQIARYPVKFLLLWGFVVPLIAGLAMSRIELGTAQGRRYERSLAMAFSSAAVLIGSTLLIAKLYPFAYDRWPATLNNGLLRLLFLGGFAGAIILFARSNTCRWRGISLLAVLLTVCGDTLTHIPWQNPSLPWHVLAGGLWQAQPDAPPAPKYGESRAFVTGRAEQQLTASTITNPTEALLGGRLALWLNLHLLDGIPKVNGATILQTRQQKQLERLLNQQTNSLPIGFLDFVGVSCMSGPSIIEWMPRTNYCSMISGGQKPEFADDTTVFTKLMESSFDSRQTVFLPPELRSNVTISNSSKVEVGDATVSMHRVKFRATAAEPAICVVAQTFYHCWRPFIDGKPAKLLRANAAFQAIVVPAGTHEIVLVYRDYAFWVGVAISVATIGACVLLWWRDRVRPGSLRSASEEDGIQLLPTVSDDEKVEAVAPFAR